MWPHTGAIAAIHVGLNVAAPLNPRRMAFHRAKRLNNKVSLQRRDVIKGDNWLIGAVRNFYNIKMTLIGQFRCSRPTSMNERKLMAHPPDAPVETS